MENAEQHLVRWERAGLIDASTAAAIRSFEATRTKQGGRQWMILLVLILGGILLGAGVLLFVAAHWAELSPLNRMLLVLAMLVFFHGIGLLVRDRFDALATAMHAVGTVSAGAAIALVGQIFNMQEHWPAAVLLWAICAAAGWLLLRDQFQQTLTLLLFPAWIISEWTSRTSSYIGVDIYRRADARGDRRRLSDRLPAFAQTRGLRHPLRRWSSPPSRRRRHSLRWMG